MKLKKILFLIGFASMFLGFHQKVDANITVKIVCFFPDGNAKRNANAHEFPNDYTVKNATDDILRNTSIEVDDPDSYDEAARAPFFPYATYDLCTAINQPGNPGVNIVAFNQINPDATLQNIAGTENSVVLYLFPPGMDQSKQNDFLKVANIEESNKRQFNNPQNQMIDCQIVVPGREVRWFAVNTGQTVNDLLNRILPNGSQNFELIFDGQILMRQARLGFYGISKDAYLIIIPNADTYRQMATHWIDASMNDEDFNDAIKTLVSQPKEEFDRLRDLRRTRLEERPKTFKKLARATVQDAPTITNDSTPTVVSPTPQSISEDPLPVFW